MKKIVFLLFIIATTFSCTEPYILKSTNFEEALVIEATITNELKTQQIKLSKTYRLEENGPEFVENATVFVEDDLGNVYDFDEGNEIYESENPFQAVPGRKYKLTIIANGKTYTSTQEVLTSENPIQNVEANDITIEGERGVEIKVNAFDPTFSSKYYRYEYEETYKIIAPKWIPYTVTVNPNTTEFIYTPRTYEARTCYSTVKSNTILLNSTTSLTEDRVDYKVRFIPVTDPIIKHRYSILVRQYVQNLESYTYYNTLKKISSNQSILSQNQPGFFSGNITCTNNPEEKVIGFFDVSTVSSQRIFFNFQDIFPNTQEPGYFFDCYDCIEPDVSKCPGANNYCFDPSQACDGYLVMSTLNSPNPIEIFFEYLDPIVFLIPPPCGDCTKFSSNVVPPFWQ